MLGIPDLATAETEIRNELSRFAAAFKAQDLSALVSAWSDDVVDIQNGLSTTEGPEALALRRSQIQDTFERFEGELGVTLDEVRALDPDWVLVRGALIVHLVERGTGDRLTRSKRFMELWNRERGGWHIRYGMTNI